MSEQSVPEEQIVPRGREIYERSIRPELGPKDEGKFVLIDVSGGTYAVDEDFARASGRADSEALCSFARVGANWAPAPAHRIGGFLQLRGGSLRDAATDARARGRPAARGRASPPASLQIAQLEGTSHLVRPPPSTLPNRSAW